MKYIHLKISNAGLRRKRGACLLFFCNVVFAVFGQEARFSPNPQVDSLLTFAHEHIGSPYRSGGTSPKGFDCSGFTSFVYGNLGYRLERVSANQVFSGTELGKNDQLMPGDLVFFKGRNAKSSRIGHVGIVVEAQPNGDFSFIHAGVSSGVCVEKNTSAYYTPRFVTACRVIDPQSVFRHQLPEKEKPIEPKTHIVEKGETLYSISKLCDCSVDDLKTWNSLPDNTLSIGQTLLLNPPKEATMQTVEHEVAKGETLFSLSVKYGCSVNDIMLWNELPSSTISIGQKLKIKIKS